jgi:methylase of polypeptide subunit release factors
MSSAEVPPPHVDQVVQEYLSLVTSLASEAARAHRFTPLLGELFRLQPQFIEEYVAGVETFVKVRQKDTIIRGKADELFGNVIIEFERDLSSPAKEAEAQEQLRKYVACLWAQEPRERRTPYLCIATDGVLFQVYTPTMDVPDKEIVVPEEIQLQAVDRLDARTLVPLHQLYYWLDRYLLRQEIVVPRTENIVKEFGIRSHTFHVAGQRLLREWQNLKNLPEYKVIYETWEKYLRLVYGSSVGDEELFMRHTYLASLAKLMACLRVSRPTPQPHEALLESVLRGEFFKGQGIENFLEEDFFSWPARPEAHATGILVARQLMNLLYKYDFSNLSEDVLKSLYEELVDPKTRHDLGEYYTPDWLAVRMIRRLLEEHPRASVLDPACGSGTFLYQVVREKRRLLGESAETLAHIQESVVGVDIHPLAVIVAKTNYVLALGDLLQKRAAKIIIPIYLANTIRLPEQEAQLSLWRQLPSYRVDLAGQNFYIPQKLLQQPGLYDEAIDAARNFTLQLGAEQKEKDFFLGFLRSQYPKLAKEESLVEALLDMARTLAELVSRGRDTIWAFVLKNAFKPFFLRNRFDVVIGNPPWLSYRYVEQPDYQNFLKGLITETYGLLFSKAELITHMELATLFFLRSADLYLREGGTVAFVLPRGIFTSDQHDAFRRGTFSQPHLRFEELWDLEQVEPLFNVPACVLFAKKAAPSIPVGQKEASPIDTRGIPGELLSGKLPRRNASPAEADPCLQVQKVQFFLNRRGHRSFWSTTSATDQLPSFYRDRFFQGATLVPRVFWFVDVPVTMLGINPQLPPVISSEKARQQAKDPYRDLTLSGNIECRFVYATLLSTDLVPFGHLGYRMVILPIESEGDHYRLLQIKDAWRGGYVYLASWLQRVEEEWQKRRGLKAKRMTALQWLDYRGKLSKQNPQLRYRVIYARSGTHLCACVLEKSSINFSVGEQSVPATGFVADSVTYFSEISVKMEAYYLAAVLNSGVTDALIKPAQSRGLWGPRDICKKVLDLPIPPFDRSRESHRRLARLGQTCTRKVASWLAEQGDQLRVPIGRLRSKIREILRKELTQIDSLVKELFGI